MSAKWAWWLLLVGCLAPCCGVRMMAQAPAAAPAADVAFPIQLDVVVTDKGGNPITGLKQEDFTVLDNKQPVKINSFKAHEAGDGTAAAVIVVLDNLNANFNAVTTERLQLEDYFKKNGGKLSNPMGVFALTEAGLDEMTPISSDGNALADALHKKVADSPMGRVSQGFYGAEERLNTSLQAISALGRYLNVDGRKVVIWLGPGWPVIDSGQADIGPAQEKFFYETTAELSRMLQNERITIHSVNMVGSGSGSASSSTSVGNAAGSPLMLGSTGGGNSSVERVLPWEDFMKPLTKENKALPGHVALQVLAIHSGGTVVSGSNDIAKEVNRCAQDATAWYTVTIDTQKATAPNTWHDLDTKIDKPQVKVRTDNGYYTQP